MPASVIRDFTDPDDYAATIRASDASFRVIGRGAFQASETRIDLHRLWMQRLCDSLPRTLHLVAPGTRDVIYFSTPGGDPLLRGGSEVGPDRIVRMAVGQESFQRSLGQARAATMSLPLGELSAAAAAITGRELPTLTDDAIVTPPAEALERLQRLHGAVGQLAEQAPEIIANAEAARGLEQTLVTAMVGCLAVPDVAEEKAAQRHHERIMRRFHAALEARADEAVFIPELCAEVGASERTLQTCCQESLGVGPKRYLLLRRMTRARLALLKASAETTTVTAIAADCGFWHLGRFAVEYRSIYEESPSATLRAPPP